MCLPDLWICHWCPFPFFLKIKINKNLKPEGFTHLSKTPIFWQISEWMGSIFITMFLIFWRMSHEKQMHAVEIQLIWLSNGATLVEKYSGRILLAIFDPNFGPIMTQKLSAQKWPETIRPNSLRPTLGPNSSQKFGPLSGRMTLFTLLLEWFWIIVRPDFSPTHTPIFHQGICLNLTLTGTKLWRKIRLGTTVTFRDQVKLFTYRSQKWICGKT